MANHIACLVNPMGVYPLSCQPHGGSHKLVMARQYYTHTILRILKHLPVGLPSFFFARKGRVLKSSIILIRLTQHGFFAEFAGNTNAVPKTTLCNPTIVTDCWRIQMARCHAEFPICPTCYILKKKKNPERTKGHHGVRSKNLHTRLQRVQKILTGSKEGN